jgi:hypothetical protein
MKVLVCGGRTWGEVVPPDPDLEGEPLRLALAAAHRQAESERDALYDTLDALHRDTPITALAEGGAVGADRHASTWAERRGVWCTRYEAEWRQYGKQAGPLRNQRMLDEFQPALVVAFPGGAGTADMVRRARRAGVRVLELAR